MSNINKHGVSRWSLKNTTKLRNLNRLKADIKSVSGALYKFTQFGLIVRTYLSEVVRYYKISFCAFLV